jgi:secondary thiamine-phosphate synthase enzyme
VEKHKWLLNTSTCPGFLRSQIVAHVEAGPNTHHTEYIFVKIPERYALVNINELVEEVLLRSNVKDGLCFISAMHITAGVYVNDAESGLLQDISTWLENLAPFKPDYLHHNTGEDNADAHLKSYLTNHSLIAPITNGHLDFGTWQQIFYAEFDGKREKRILVKVTGLKA